MAELKLSGNHLKGSRPVVTFDAAFDEQPHLQARCLNYSRFVRTSICLLRAFVWQGVILVQIGILFSSRMVSSDPSGFCTMLTFRL